LRVIYSYSRTKISRNSQLSYILCPTILFSGLGLGAGFPGLQFGLGAGAGCGVGMGFGYGMGKGVVYDDTGKHTNIGNLFQEGLPGQ
jgi:hypothetical protein